MATPLGTKVQAKKVDQIFQSGPFSEKLLSYVQKVEGSRESQETLGSYKDNLFHPYASIASIGGQVIGYGHRITNEERKNSAYMGGIPHEAAVTLLKTDLVKAEGEAKRVLGRSWYTLDRNRKEMAIEFAFNLGGSSFRRFKRFRKALLEGDYKAMAKESIRYYKTRYGRWKKLEPRNQEFKQTFISPYLDNPRLKTAGRIIANTDRNESTKEAVLRLLGREDLLD